ncbi:MAG: carboxypeptidase regulatory-like domain-containing protein, partial [Bacteroidota bacterium]
MKKIISLLMFVVCASAILYAQVPSPTNLTVGQNPSTIGAYLHWKYASNVGLFKIFRAVDSSEFVYRGTAQITSYTDVEVPSGHIYRYYVRAYVNGGASEPSNIVTFIPNTPSPIAKGIVAGSVVKDETGEPMVGSWLRFVRPGNQYAAKEVSIGESGHYAVALDTGKYQIQAQKQGYVSEWYDNKPSRDNADIIVVAENDSLFANFSLAPVPPPQVGMIAGTVLKESDQTAIIGAKLLFYSPNSNQAIKYTFTDSTGNYHVELTAGSYVVQAKREGFVAEWFDNKLERSEADAIVVTNNQTATADFQLANVPPPQVGLIAGTVLKEADQSPLAGAKLYFYTGNSTQPAKYAYSDSLGNYHIALSAGNYFVQAKREGFIAEWFDNKLERSEADVVVVANNQTATADFQLANIPTPASGMIGGTVVDETTMMPLAGAYIGFYNSNGNGG